MLEAAWTVWLAVAEVKCLFYVMLGRRAFGLCTIFQNIVSPGIDQPCLENKMPMATYFLTPLMLKPRQCLKELIGLYNPWYIYFDNKSI